jgi:hypothetical protein
MGAAKDSRGAAMTREPAASVRYRPDPYALYRCPYCNRDCKLYEEGIVIDSYMNVCHVDCLPTRESEQNAKAKP